MSLFEALISGLNIHHHSDWVIFDERLKSTIKAGLAREIQKTRTIYAPSEDWYLDPASGEIYVYLRPDDRVLPEWTKVDIFAKPKAKARDPKNISTSGLGAIPLGAMDQTLALSLKYLLQRMAAQDEIEIVANPLPNTLTKECAFETVFRDVKTGLLYRLVELVEGQGFLWERVPTSEDHTHLQ